jgi:uncharacterized protein (TIGR00369 family)
VTPEEGNKILADNFAPWVLDLGLVVEAVGEGTATVRLPWSDRLAREGGALSGQALMAAADTSTVIAIAAARGGYGPMTTVQQSTTFQRPVVGQDVLLAARVTKLGRTLAFVDITMTVERRPTDPAQVPARDATPGAVEADRPVAAHASTVYAILG